MTILTSHVGTNDVDELSPGEFEREYKLWVNNLKSIFGDPNVPASCVLLRPIDKKKKTDGKVNSY